MALVTLQAPAVEPVALDELKDFLRVDSNDTSQDAVLGALNTAARQWAEAYTRRRFVTQKVRLLLDAFPGSVWGGDTRGRLSLPVAGPLGSLRYAILLPEPPVQAVNAFTYIDVNANTQTLIANTNYIADLSSQPGRLTPPFGSLWPVARVQPNAVTIDYTVGYSDDGSAVPEGIKLGIKQLMSHWYENRIPGDVPNEVKALLFPMRDLRF